MERDSVASSSAGVCDFASADGFSGFGDEGGFGQSRFDDSWGGDFGRTGFDDGWGDSEGDWNSYFEPIHRAAAQGDLEAVEELLATGKNPQARNRSNETPLMVASAAGHSNIV